MTNSILSNEYVTDTMALVLHLENRRSSEKVKQIFKAVDSGEITVYVPTIVFAEILYLSEKRPDRTKIARPSKTPFSLSKLQTISFKLRDRAKRGENRGHS